MFKRFIYFAKYNNAFTLIVVICFFSFGITFAANEDARDTIYASTETVVSVDNGLIVSANLDSFNFNLRINAITEDAKNYYAAYSYQTMSVENSIWQIKQMDKTLTVSKEALDGKDLGLYVAKELSDNINAELDYLKRVQKIEKDKGASQKVVNVEYSGLIGKMINPKEEVVEGYNPVIPEPAPEAPVNVDTAPEEVIVSTPRLIHISDTNGTTTSSSLVNEQLVQDVVGSLQEQATSTATSTPPSTGGGSSSSSPASSENPASPATTTPPAEGGSPGTTPPAATTPPAETPAVPAVTPTVETSAAPAPAPAAAPAPAPAPEAPAASEPAQ